MIVEIDLFSGRPNPRWELGPVEARALEKLEAGLRPAAGPPPEPPALGYRGFVYRSGGGMRRAYGGQIRGEERALEDPQRRIERLLLDSLPADLAAVRERVAPLLKGGAE